jgi:hypothetical protein
MERVTVRLSARIWLAQQGFAIIVVKGNTKVIVFATLMMNSRSTGISPL